MKLRTFIHTTATAIALLCLTTAASCPKQPDGTPYNYAAEARELGEGGTLAALIDNPNHRYELEDTAAALRALEQISGPVTLDMLRRILQRLPVEKFQSPKVQLYVLTGTMFLRRVGGDVELGNIPDVKPIVTALREGIEAGLGTPQ